MSIEKRRHGILSTAMLKHLNVNNCDGDTVFLEELQKKGVDLEIFVFTATSDNMRGQYLISSEEKEKLIECIRSLRSLKALCLGYTPQPKVTKVYDPYDIDGNQKPLRDHFPSSPSPAPQQASEVCCTFLLERILVLSREYSLQSMALAQ